jgi:hypothetical protein
MEGDVARAFRATATRQRRCKIDEQPSSPRRRYQFTLGALLFLMTAIAVVAGIFPAMLHPSIGAIRLLRAFFVILIMVAPFGLMVVLWLILLVRQWIRDRHLPPDE